MTMEPLGKRLGMIARHLHPDHVDHVLEAQSELARQGAEIERLTAENQELRTIRDGLRARIDELLEVSDG